MTETELFELVWQQCWQVTVLIAVVWLATRPLRRRSPQIACALWLVVLLKCLTPPVWSSSVGVFCWMPAWPEAAVSSDTERADELPVTTEPIVTPAIPETETLVVMPAEEDSPAAITAAATQLSVPVESAISWSEWLLRIWAGGLIAAAVCLLARLTRCLLLIRRSTASPELQAVTDELAGQLQLRRSVRLRITASNVGPAVTGLLRPVIILPQTIVSSVPPESLRPVIMHELIHIRRRDLWVGLLQSLTRVVWWFHPLVHAAARETSHSVESCCDQESLAALDCSPRDYADCLLTILERKKELTPVPVFPGIRSVDLTSSRLEQIMKPGHGSLRINKWWRRATAILVAALVLPGAGMVAPESDAADNAQHTPEDTAQQSTRSSKDNTAAADDNNTPAAPPFLESRAYDVHDVLLAYAVASGLELQAARNSFEQYVRDECQSPELILSWTEGKLIAATNSDSHLQLRRLLAGIRVHGIQPMDIRVTIADLPRDQRKRWLISDRPAWIRRARHRWPLNVNSDQSAAELWPENGQEVATFSQLGPGVTGAILLSDQQRDNLLDSLNQEGRVVEHDGWCKWLDRRVGTLVSASTQSVQLTSDSGVQEERGIVTGYLLKLRPVVAGGTITIDCQLQTSQDLQRTSSASEESNRPHIQVIRMSCEVQLRDSQTVAVTGEPYQTNSGSEMTPVLMLTPILNGQPVIPAAHHPEAPDHFIARAYQVADLVVPLRHQISVSLPIHGSNPELDTAPTAAPAGTADFRALLDLITATIEPGSWAINGGEGAIGISENTLSVVIRQRQDVHDRIIGLLEQLRQLQNCQVATEVTLLRIPRAHEQSLGIPMSVMPSMSVDPSALLDSTQLGKWHTFAANSDFRHQRSFKAQLVPGTVLSMRLSADDVLNLQPVVSADHRTVRFTLASADQRPGSSYVVSDGQSVLIDITGRLNAAGDPDSTPDERLLMCLTPTIIEIEEEAQTSGLQPYLPNRKYIRTASSAYALRSRAARHSASGAAVIQPAAIRLLDRSIAR